jgi:hypothetical protein
VVAVVTTTPVAPAAVDAGVVAAGAPVAAGAVVATGALVGAVVAAGEHAAATRPNNMRTLTADIGRRNIEMDIDSP